MQDGSDEGGNERIDDGASGPTEDRDYP
ncbi:MAG: hypothetical protein QOJ59_2007, partial [Thermomicrobiales bacterium]|nr:hypothetical protein [Thermomicrobiales bacterium]